MDSPNRMASIRIGLVGVEIAGRLEAEQAGEVPVLEDPGDDAEGRGDRNSVHRHRLERQHERAERQEQQHQHHADHDQAHPGQVVADRVDQVDGVGGEPADEDLAAPAARPRGGRCTISWDCSALAVAVPERPQQRGVALRSRRAGPR